MKSGVYALLFVGLAAAPALGQSTDQLERGQRLKLVTRGVYFYAPIVTFLETRGDTLIVMDGKESRPVPKSAIATIEVASGRRRQAKKGALIGAIAGPAAFGLALFIVPEQKREPCPNVCYHYGDPESDAVAGLLVTAGAGALLGALIGFFDHTDRWKSIVVAASVEPRGKVDVRFSLPVRGR